VNQELQPQVDAAALRRFLEAHFSDGELRDLCFDLQIEYDNLPGERKADKARELVTYAQRHGRAPELVEWARRLRPRAEWGSATPASGLPAQDSGANAHLSDGIREIDRKVSALLESRNSQQLHDYGKEQLIAALELIRANRLGEAVAVLEELEGLGGRLPGDLMLRVLYDRACAESLLADAADRKAPAHGEHLDRALAYVLRWVALGQAGQWRAAGLTAYNEIHRMAATTTCATFSRRRSG
jgi:hypothetical protein